MIVVIDTNVWISALIFGKPGNVPARAIKRATTQDVLVASTELLDELRRILSDKYLWPADRIADQIDRFFLEAQFLPLHHTIHICRDPKDNMFLECAALSHADVLVTGDKDLLTLGIYDATRILTPSQYLDLPD